MVENITNNNKKISLQSKPFDWCWSIDFDSVCGDVGGICPITKRKCIFNKEVEK